MFRDRVVSMEQTFEKGEKHLSLLQGLVEEALPGLEFHEYVLDHEHDTFVMVYRAPSGEEKRIRWTRMVLSERIPAILEDAQAPIRGRIVEFLRRRAERAVIDVTFRHLEEGWVDTPEPRKPKPRPSPAQRSGGQASPPPGQSPRRGASSARPSPPQGGQPATPPRPGPASPETAAPGNRRRRFRRRRGRRRGPGTPGGAPPA
jgi:hypothetical protein